MVNAGVILLIPSRPIKWDNNFVHQAYLQHFHSSKTITTLYLERNSIGDEGTHHLANALKKNQVNDVHCIGIISSSSSFIVDHHDTESWAQPDRPWRSTSYWWCCKGQSSERGSLFTYYIWNITIRHRWLLCSILTVTKSAIKERVILVMLSRSIKWDKFSNYMLYVEYCHSS